MQKFLHQGHFLLDGFIPPIYKKCLFLFMDNYTTHRLLSELERDVLIFIVNNHLRGYRAMHELSISHSLYYRTTAQIKRDFCIQFDNPYQIYDLLANDRDKRLALALKIETLTSELPHQHETPKLIDNPEKKSYLDRLSKREKQIFLFLGHLNATELTDAQIAMRFDITINTFKKHLQNIYKKLSINTRASLAILSFQSQLT